MKNKVTLRDIAREANVSVATVSYVLNNRNDQSISEATRKKILQIVNLYNYKLNLSAKRIASGKTNIIAMCLGKHDFALHKAEPHACGGTFVALPVQTGLQSQHCVRRGSCSS